MTEQKTANWLEKIHYTSQKKKTQDCRDNTPTKLKKKFKKKQNTKMRKKIKIFKEIGFKIDIKTYLKEVDFFNIILNIHKWNDDPLTLHTSSSHLPMIIKQIP